MSLADRFPRLRDRKMPDWVKNAPDDDADLVQAARDSWNSSDEDVDTSTPSDVDSST